MIVFAFLFIQLAIAGGLIVLLRHIMRKHYGSASSRLEILTQDAINKLDDAKRKVDEANKYFAEVQVKGKEAGEQARQQLTNEGIKEKQDLIEQARKQSEEIMQRAKMTAESLTQELESKVQKLAVERACEIIQKVLPGKMSSETHSEWVGELLEGPFNELDRMNISESANGIEVVTAFPLKASEKQKLEERLKEKLKKAVKLTEKVDPSLILGVRLKIGQIVMDGSFKFTLEEAVRHAEARNG
ncbi:MAG: F0F1 ATP synthase subunit delta [Candidatus Omnitrophica bacterium]|nr:F0F1 ATP synthase subunit delta [Candidatus Omnitrophota bacterium]